MRDVQVDVLDAWYGNREKRDTIVKMNTGSGKTLVGLLMLQSSLNEGIGPALYLCPTHQLVDQVVNQARQYGITVLRDVPRNPLPFEFLNSEAILVTTFSRFFNGQSVFGVEGRSSSPVEVGAIVIDDAHSCLAIAREQASITFQREEVGYSQFLGLFRGVLEEQSAGTAASIFEGDSAAFLAVPYWAWLNCLNDVASILSQLSREEEGNVKFAWPLMQGCLEICHCLVSGRKILITPHVLPVERIPAFKRAKRRFYLSATLIDDAALIRDFGLSEDIFSNPLHPKIKGDVGERLIIAPGLIDSSISKEEIYPWVATFARKGYNIVVLCPSFNAASRWQQIGARVAGEGRDIGVQEAIKQLHDSRGNIIVLVNRYDGIDLPGDACRILVLDGLPVGGDLYEQYVMAMRPDSQQVRLVQAQKIEQGLGRGVRSGSDYCAVLLVDHDLVSFVITKQNQQLLSPETRRQLEIGRDLARRIRDSGGDILNKLGQLIEQCLKQDPGWKKFHRQRLADLEEVQPNPLPRQLAVVERKAIKLFQANQGSEAAQVIQQALDELKLNDNADKGWYLQLAAHFCHRTDPARAQEIQRKAHELNRNLLRPLEGIKYKKIAAYAGVQASRVVQWVRQYEDPNTMLVYVSSILDKLAFGVDSNTFEQAFEDLGNILGFRAQRPEKEYGRGPDVLWVLTKGHYLVIEVKNQVDPNRDFIAKKEAGQLANSVNWFRSEYGEAEMTPILVHPSNKAAPDAFPPAGTKVLTCEGLNRLCEKVRSFTAALATKAPGAWMEEEVGRILAASYLIPRSFLATFFTDLRLPH
ncbi:DEAD/DEAH box helicase [Neomoorella mulderi]|uniref:DEAD/DEAH box helicase n=1 Tax=Neomoorella mulderi TaxID=202604 RepID=UPI0013723C7B|nr:DEAD/DEAH box helicase [Moorella mulderi]